MEVISYEYNKVRRDFGTHPTFSDSPATMLCSVPPDEKYGSQWASRRVTHRQLDCIPQVASHWGNTGRFIPASKGVSHTEGAWPLDVKVSDFNDRLRLLRRITNEPAYHSAVQTLTKTAMFAIQQNNTIDMYEEYFEDVEDVEIGDAPITSKTLAVFRDPNGLKRSAVKISWHPELSNKLAVSYAIMQFQSMPANMPLASYIWDVNNPNHPDAEVIPSSPLCSLVYNPRSPDQLVGGSYNGLVGFWDLRKGSAPVLSSVIEKSHHDPVYDVCWVQSRSGNECCSVSTDGMMLWWDIRKLKEGPTDSMKLADPSGSSYGATCLEYNSDAGPTRYLVGTEAGCILQCDRKAKKDAESQKSIKTVYGKGAGRHHGPVVSVVRNPTNSKYFLSVGDWSAKLWSEDLKTPIMSTRYDTSYLTAAAWSPVRPSVFFLTKLDGSLEAWDLYHKHQEPAYSVKLSDVGLSCISPHSSGRVIALGSQDGTTTILEVSKGLYTPVANERTIMGSVFDREFKREKALDVRMNARKREKPDEKKQGAAAVPEPSAAETEENLKIMAQVEAEFADLMAKGGDDEGRDGDSKENEEEGGGDE